jgi:hypothetical protein
MAATAAMVGTLLMHICTNYEVIMKGTEPGGKYVVHSDRTNYNINRDWLARVYWHVLE